MEAHLKGIGVVLVVLALLHVGFPRYFNWAGELKSLSLINRQMMYVHTLFIALVVLLMGVLCLSCAPDLVSTGLGKKICLGLGLFWLARLLVQFFGYSAQLWHGKRLETGIHIIFSCMWAYIAAVFLVIYWS